MGMLGLAMVSECGQDPGISYDMFDRNAYGFDIKKASMSDHNAYEKAKIDAYVRSDRCTNLDRQW